MALVIPLAIMLGKKRHNRGQSTVLVPLYIYPSPGAWNPLFSAVTQHPKLNFTIIINPNSGPGGPGLDANYTRDIPRLNSYGNVQAVGYVSTNYTNRDLSLVQGDIDTYASWAQNSTTKGLGMQGIFLDETPSEWSNASAAFYASVTNYIRASTEFGADPFIIHNPGTIPDARYLNAGFGNLTVVFEGSFDTYQNISFPRAIRSFQRKARSGQEALAAIVYDVPDDFQGRDETRFLGRLRNAVGSVFLTGAGTDGDVYASFWTGWDNWVQDMST
ncbi:hypothetical protein EG329_004141 [Mollisiaceae sp. DMI_Dod_QoI]|nr:hypothetical protein EG329_004141 [Helotiales sp. DMI_Dod_QoI]